MNGNEFEYFLDNLSLPTLLAKSSFAFLLLSMLFYWFQASFQYQYNRETEFAMLNPIGAEDSLSELEKSTIGCTSLQCTTSFPLFNISWKEAVWSLFGKAPSLTMGLANIALALMLLIRWVESGHFPLSNLYESLLFLSWSLTSIHFFLERAFSKGGFLLPALGAITAPLALFTNAFATFSLPQEMQRVGVLVPALQSNWLIMHVSVMMVSYAALLSGSLLAMAFLVVKFFSDSLSVKNVQELGYNQDCFDISTIGKQPSSLSQCTCASPSEPPTSFARAKVKKQVGGCNALAKRTVQEDATRSDIQVCAEREDGPVLSLSSLDPLSYTNISDATGVETTMHQVQTIVAQGKGQNLKIKKTDFSIPKSEETFEEKLKQTLDNLSYRSIGLGFALLTIGIFSGAVWANEAWGSYWSWDPKETWAFVTWLVFALYLHTRLSRGWVGKESALVATFGFLVIWFCYLGVNLFGKGLHSYGWFPAN